MRTIKNILIGWSLSVLIFVIYLLAIVAPITRIGCIEDTKFQKFFLFPLYSIPYLASFLLLYISFRFFDYTKNNFIISFLWHIILYIIFNYIVIFFYLGKFVLIEVSIFLSISMYLAFHVFIMRYSCKKFKLYGNYSAK